MKRNVQAFGVFECCRDIIKTKKRNEYEAYKPEWLEVIKGLGNDPMGYYEFIHALPEGESLADVSKNDVSSDGMEEQKQAEAKFTRLSHGVPAWLRNCFKERHEEGLENPWCEFNDLMRFPGF